MERLSRSGLVLGTATLVISSFVLLTAWTAAAQKPEEKKAAPAAPAATPPAMPPAPKPAAELDQLKFLVGKWKCDGKQMATPMMGPEHMFKASADAKMDIDNFWQTWTYEEKKSKEHPGLKVHGMWGWDAGHKRFVRAGADNMGGWDEGTAPGLEGDKLVWSGEFSGPMGAMSYHHTFTKKSDKEWSYLLEIKGPDGKFMPVSEVTCKK